MKKYILYIVFGLFIFISAFLRKIGSNNSSELDTNEVVVSEEEQIKSLFKKLDSLSSNNRKSISLSDSSVIHYNFIDTMCVKVELDREINKRVFYYGLAINTPLGECYKGKCWVYENEDSVKVNEAVYYHSLVKDL